MGHLRARSVSPPLPLCSLSERVMDTPLEDFFSQFARLDFVYTRQVTAHDNFKRLHQASGWDKDSTEFKAARVDFHDALVQEFNVTFGTGTDLTSWQKLCTFIGITPVPDTVTICRQRVWDAHVNIVDLLECARTGQPVPTFATLEELRAYTLRPDKIFPKKSAYAGGLLKELLREIIHPYYGRRQNGSEKRKKRKAKKRAAAGVEQAESSSA